MGAVGRVCRILLWVTACVGTLLAAVSLWSYRADTNEIRSQIGSSINESTPPSVRMRQALGFMAERVVHGAPKGYYLLPLFESLRPTPLQVMTHGGDCASRGRAFIAILHAVGVEATKLAMYDETGKSVHAVVRVTTERGPYIVDLLYDIIHEDAQGDPIPLTRLADPAVLADSVKRAVNAGNEWATDYPLDVYGYHEVRTINWEKSALMRAAFRVMAMLVGEGEARSFRRPYLAEEPALMAACAGGAASFACLAILGLDFLWRRRSRRRAKRTGALQPAAETETRHAERRRFPREAVGASMHGQRRQDEPRRRNAATEQPDLDG